MYLEKINGPADVKALNSPERTVLATEMRTALIQKLSHHGGHCGPNLGLVEATIALHTVFDSPKDRFVFDVSHQTYPHKMLTGRSYGFLDPARYDDITGYSAPQESAHDPFTLGHTSTSGSRACGLAKARDAKGEHHNGVAIIGDGSLSGGEALEGLDLAGEMDSNLIIVVNDNGMSIAENHGGIYRNLELLRQTGGKAACNLFRAMGLDYVFQPEGNHTDALIETFQQVKDCDHPVVVHMVTEKGKGYAPAETHKENWHWCMPFDPKTGESTVHFEGEDYGDPTMETPAPEPTITPGEGFSDEGNLVTRDLLYDEHTNKQFITVQTSGGNTFYIVIDYDKPVDEEGEQYETYFFSIVDEGDLLAAAEAAGVEQAVCSCPEKCAAGAVNTDCPVCSVNMGKCVGAEPEPEPAPEPEPEPEKPGNAGMLLLVLAVMGIGGGASWYFKIYRPKHQQADQPEEDDGEEYPDYDEFEDDGPPWDEEDETEEKEEIR